MANTTVPFAESVHGTNPQYLIEKITRLKIYNSTYWKEHCFGLTSELIIDKAVTLKYCGGVYGGNNKPSNFLCLVLKLLQLQPEKEIVLEFIRNEEFKYLRLLGAFYLRMVGKPDEVYEFLEPLYNDYRKVAYRSAKGWQLTYVDEFIHWLLNEEMVCDITLPHIMRREKLEDLGQLQPRRSVLEDEFNEEEEEEDEEDRHVGDVKEEGRSENENLVRGDSGADSGGARSDSNEPKPKELELGGPMISGTSERRVEDSIDKPVDRSAAAVDDSRGRDGGRAERDRDVAGEDVRGGSSRRRSRSRSRSYDAGRSRRRRSRTSSRSRSTSRRRRRSRSRDRDRRRAYCRSRSRSDERRGGSRRRRRSSRSDSESDYERHRERRHRDRDRGGGSGGRADDRDRDRDRDRRRSRRSASRSSSSSRERGGRRHDDKQKDDRRREALQPAHEPQSVAESDDFESRMDAELAQAQAEAQKRKDEVSSKKFDKMFGKSKSTQSSGGDGLKIDKSKFAEGSVEYWNEMREKLGMKKLKS